MAQWLRHLPAPLKVMGSISGPGDSMSKISAAFIVTVSGDVKQDCDFYSI